MVTLAKPNPQAMKAGKNGGYGAPKASLLKITAANADRFATEIINRLQEFIFFEQSYSQLTFLAEGRQDTPLKPDEEKLHSKIDKLNRLFEDHLNSIEQPVPVKNGA